MKIKRITISPNKCYGHFSGCDFDFDTENLVVVYGPNESGKSTFLNLVRDLLFGIKKNTEYAFEGTSQKMQMSALLELGTANDAPRRLEIMRRKGNKDVLTGRFDDGETIDEIRFKKLLNLPDRNEYENVFGFTQAILSSDLSPNKGGGSLAQMLYSTAFRMGGIGELKKQLKDESDAYFIYRGSTKAINANAKQIEELFDELEDSRVDRDKYVELEKRLATQAEEIGRLEKNWAAKEREKWHLEKLQKSRADYLTLKRSRALLRQIDESNAPAVRFPVDGKMKYQNLTAAIAESQNAIDENAKSIAQTKMQIELQKRQCHEGVLSIAVPLHRLAGHRSAYHVNIQRLSELSENIEGIKQRIEVLLKRLAPNAKLETVVEWAVTDTTFAELESLQKRARDLIQEITGHESRLNLLQTQLAERDNMRKKLAATSTGDIIADDDGQRIELLNAGRSQYESDCEKLHNAETQRNSLADEIKKMSKKLALKLGLDENAFADDDSPCELPVLRQFPDENVIREYEREIDSLRKKFEKQDGQLAEHADKLADCKLEIAKLDTGSGKPPTRKEVRQERANRDRVWRHFRRRHIEAGKHNKNTSDALLDDVFDETPTPELYEQLVRAADEMADLLFDRVNDVQRLEMLTREHESYTQRVETLQSERQAVQGRFDGLVSEWLALWPGCDAKLVKRPSAMYAARQDWDKWQQLRQQLHSMTADIARLQSRKNRFERQANELAAKIPNIGIFGHALPNGEIVWDVPEMRTLCQSLKAAADQQTEHRRQMAECRASMAVMRSEIKAAQTTVSTANDRLAKIGGRARHLAAGLGLFNDETVDKSCEGIEQPIGEMLDMLLNACGLIRRIQDEHATCCHEQELLHEIKSQVRQFEHDAATCLQTVAWDADMASLTTPELLTHALALLDQAEKAKGELHTLETKLTMLNQTEKLEREKQEKRRAEQHLMLEKAGVSDSDTFLQLAAIADERRQVAEQMTKAERQLLIILETTDLSLWENELENRFGNNGNSNSDNDGINDSGGDNNGDISERFISGERLDLTTLLEKVEAETRQLRETLDQLREEKGGLDRDLSNLRQSDGAIAIAEQVEYARKELLKNVNRFVPRLLALRTLEYAIEKFEREQQPETLKQIRRYFAAMTGGRYTNVGLVRIDDDDRLVVYDEGNNKEKTVEQLSTGTREQLHLAVRLAYISNFCKTREPLPVVLDDVLVNFDPSRQVETLRFLGELSKQMQIIFLTCHDATLDMVRETVPSLSMISL